MWKSCGKSPQKFIDFFESLEDTTKCTKIGHRPYVIEIKRNMKYAENK